MSKEKRPRRPVPKPKVQVQTVTLSASELKATVKSEEGVEEIMAAPEMKPYMDLARAWVSHSDVRPALAAIQAAPLEKRYVWRIASALKWGFADFDDLSVRADRDTLARADFARLMELLEKRPIQLCFLFAMLVGKRRMEKIMLYAIEVTKQASNAPD